MADFEDSGLQLRIPSPFSISTASHCNTPHLNSRDSPLKHAKSGPPIQQVNLELQTNKTKALQRTGSANFKKLTTKHFKKAVRVAETNSKAYPEINEGHSTLAIMRGGNCQSVAQAKQRLQTQRLSSTRESHCIRTGCTSTMVEGDFGVEEQTINRRIEKQEEAQRSKAKHKKCFYNNLKKKLEWQINSLKGKNAQTATRMIEGCQQHNNLRGVSYVLDIRSVVPSPRPGTSTTRSGVDITSANSDRYKRPMTSRERSINTKKVQRAIHSVREEEKQRLYSARNKKDSPKMNRLASDSGSSVPTFSRTFSGSREMKVRGHSVERSREKEKLLGILLDCEQAAGDSVRLHKGMRVFGYYCNKVGQGLGRVSEVLQHCLKQGIDDNE